MRSSDATFANFLSLTSPRRYRPNRRAIENRDEVASAHEPANPWRTTSAENIELAGLRQRVRMALHNRPRRQMPAMGQNATLVAPSRHDHSCSRSRLKLKPQAELACPIGLQKGIGTLRPARSVAPRERKGYAASSRAISVSKSKRNCAPSSSGKHPVICGKIAR